MLDSEGKEHGGGGGTGGVRRISRRRKRSRIWGGDAGIAKADQQQRTSVDWRQGRNARNLPPTARSEHAIPDGMWPAM
eukprot:639484-Pyramimonas_sp.AAC.1